MAMVPPGFFRAFSVDKPVDSVENCSALHPIFSAFFLVYVNRYSVTRTYDFPSLLHSQTDENQIPSYLTVILSRQSLRRIPILRISA